MAVAVLMGAAALGFIKTYDLAWEKEIEMCAFSFCRKNMCAVSWRWRIPEFWSILSNSEVYT